MPTRRPSSRTDHARITETLARTPKSTSTSWKPVDPGFDAGRADGEEQARHDSTARETLRQLRDLARTDIEAAVYAARLYIGKGLTMRVTDEQKLYRRMNSKIAAVAKRLGMDEAEAYRQIVEEAKRRGRLTALPGKDI